MSKARELAALGNAYSDGALSNRNLIINGELIVNQRNNVSGGDVGNGTYTYDRWVTVQTLSANTSAGGGYQNSPSLRMDATATASGQVAMEQRIESPSSFDGLTITVSAWVKSNSSNCYINIYDFGWNGIKSNSHTGGGGWELLTATGTLSTGMTDLWVRIGLSDQGNTSITSGDYFDFTQVQLERGDTATPFEHRSYGDELARCLRYFQIWEGDGNTLGAGVWYASNQVVAALPLQQVMRAGPTVSVSAADWATVYGVGTSHSTNDLTASVDKFNVNSLRLNLAMATTTTAGQGAMVMLKDGSQWLKADAEL